ncbi:MAG: hypothetical protein ACR2H5_20985 [Ktedonobacteraceae bacterium]
MRKSFLIYLVSISPVKDFLGRPQGIAPTIYVRPSLREAARRAASDIVGAIPCGRPGRLTVALVALLSPWSSRFCPGRITVALVASLLPWSPRFCPGRFASLTKK